ncbi:hypothetical protein [Succinivibrio dextrinosolvens]|jgi:hypothetical protein|uniref:hypothetical protein n=1 Tax=Succinivibrio dextrinosolvens TaxID=83771 RepID=UPI002479B4C5|nr:hypothetical protein [Succinivibrio dextrinosolvens]
MYIQIKKSNNTQYVYLVESFRKEDGSIGHRTLNKLGKLDDLLKDDPNALEKLKKEVKEKSAELKGAIKKDVVTRLNSMAKSSRLKKYENGFPQVNYAYAIFNYIWSDILKLDYRLNYLQSRYHSKLKYSLSEVILANLVIAILGYEDEDGNDLVYGPDLGFLGVNYTAEQLKEYMANSHDILNEESLYMLRFIVKQLSAEYDMDFLSTSLNQSGLKLDSDTLEKLQMSGSEATVSKEELIFTKTARFNQMSSYLRLIMMKIIRFKLEQYTKESFDYSEIRAALREAIVLVDYPLVEGESFLYVKRNNGKNVILMNKILKSMGMSPLFNIQDKTELGHRLHLKLKEDSKIVPSFIMKKI